MGNIVEQIRKAARGQSVFRANDVKGVIDPRSTLRRLVAKGEIIRVGRGLYARPNTAIGSNHALAEATRRYPGGVICLTSALYFHGIGTQIPRETWMMRSDRKAAPREGPPLHFVYSSGKAFSFGVKTHRIEGVAVRISTPAKTVADCFKYRNKSGLDVAMEALHEGWRARRFTMDELWNAAHACRVQNVMQPYLEMLAR